MNARTKLLIASAAGALALGTSTVGHAFAASSTSNPASDLVSMIATKFNLKQVDVQAVFDQHHTEMETERAQKEADRLTQAVTNGKITADQKTKIETEQAAIKSKMDEIKDMTDQTARRTAMEQLRTDTKKWADDNGIDLKWLRPLGGRGHGGPGMMPGGPDGDATAPISATTSN